MATRRPLSVLFAAGTCAALALTVAPATASPGRDEHLTDTTVRGIDVDRATIPQLQRAMDRHRLTSVQLVQLYERRITKVDPLVHAVIRTNPRALAEARAADRARRHGDRRPLLGIPVLVKDNVDTTGMPTTAGSEALAGSTPPDAFIVRRLKAAGALVIGKANLSEWANYRSTNSTSGWSAVGGQTNNPYVLDRNPCGSSSGSGAGVAADLATVGIGTETDGSIVCPSGQNGVVGLKPTLGLASRTGIVPISAEQDTAGPITRNVTDAAVVLGALTGVDPDDSATAAQTGHVRRDYTGALDAGALKGARIGVWRSAESGDAPTTAVMDQVVARLRSLGATVVEPTDIPIEPAYDPENTALEFEFKHDIAAYLQRWTGPAYPKTLADLIAFNTAHASTELKYFGQEIFEESQARGPLTDPTYVAARQSARSIARQSIDQTLAEHDLDAVIAPTNSPAWRTTLGQGDAFVLGSSTPSAVAGYPNLTVPGGYAGALPVGVSFIGRQWDEAGLLALGYAWEQGSHVRRKPEYLRTIG